MTPRPPHLAHLKADRGRSDVVVFGRRAVLEALACASVEVEDVRVAKRVAADFRRELGAACRAAEVACETVAPESVSQLSGEPRHDQGVAARVRLTKLMEMESFIDQRKGASAREPTRILALDGLTNSQNIGMLIRSAVAAGIGAIVWPLVGSPWVNGLVIKASASTVFDCPIVRCPNLVQGLSELQAAGFRCIGLAADAEQSLFDYAPPHRAVFVIGAETTGISPEARDLLDERIRIPMQGGVESLNVAVAASLLCFQVARRDA